MHSFGYSALVLTSSHPGQIRLKMQRTASWENSTITRREKECSINKRRSSWAIPVPLLLKVGWFPVYGVGCLLSDSTKLEIGYAFLTACKECMK